MPSARLSILALFSLLASPLQAAQLLVSHYSGNLYSLNLTATGNNGAQQLAITSTLRAGGGMPSWLTLDPSDRTLYATDETQYGNPVLTALAVQADGTLRSTSAPRSPGAELHSALYSGSGGKKFLATAEYATSSIATFALPLTSSTQALQRLKFTMPKPGPVPSRQDAPHPHGVFVDPTGKYLLAPDLGADLIRIFAIDSSTGNLTACPAIQTPAGDGPRHGAFWSPNGNTSTAGLMFYVVNELGNSVSAWSVAYPSSNGGCLTLNRTQTLSTYPAGKAAPTGSKAAEVHVSGNFLYAANRNDQSFGSRNDSMATYGIDVGSGRIAFVEATPAYSYFPRTFAINRAGDLVAVGGQTSATVAVLPVGNPGTVNGEDGLSAVIWDE